MYSLKAIMLVAAVSLPLAAQSNLGRIVGTVKDSSGAAVPAAKVKVINEGTNQAREFQSLDDGGYEVANLVAGVYRVEAEVAGFKRFTRGRIVLDAGRTIRVDAEMEIGGITEEVRITDRPPLIETDTPSVANTLSYEFQTKSAVGTGARPWEVLVTMPLIQSGPSDFVYSVAGSRGAQTEFQIDGIASPAAGSPLGSSSMTMEGTSELRVQGVNNSAEYSQPGIFQQVSRSGTNEVHGNLFYYHTNSALNARSFFSPTKPSVKRHTFGGWLGAPLVIPKLYDGRNRTFLMLAYEGTRNPSSTTANATVPTASMRGGDFSGIRGLTLRDPSTNTPFPGNRIPANRINGVSQRIQERFYPLPNFGDPNEFTTLNHRILFNNSTQFNNADLRVDQRIGESNMLYGRFGWIQFNNKSLEGSLPTIGQRSQLRNLRTGVISDTHVFRPTLINELRVGFQRSRNPFHGPQLGLEVLADVGIQGIQNVPDAYGMPIVQITGVNTLTQIQESVSVEQAEQLSNAVTWIRGRHTMKAGLDVRHQDPNITSVPIGTYGNYNFTVAYTGIGYGDFLLGIPQQTQKTYPAPPDYRRQMEYGFFVNDDFKLGPRLTLQLGLRYEYQTPTTHKRDTMYNFDPATGELVLVSASVEGQVSRLFNPRIPIRTADGTVFPERSLWTSDLNNFAPRAGVAWRPTGKADFAVRAGYGIYYDRLGVGVTSGFDGGPFTPGSELYTNAISGGVPQFQFPRPFPNSVAGPSTAPPTVNSVLTGLRNPYVQQWNLSIERALAGVGVRASYIGSKGTQLLYRRNINKPLASTIAFNQNRRPYTLYTDIIATEQGGNSNYHALQFEATKRFSSLSFDAGYTWSNVISDAADSGQDPGDIIENSYSRSSARGRETYAIRHRLVGNALWQVPVGKGRPFLGDMPAALNHVLGGWETLWTFTVRSGRWFTPSFTGSDPSNTNTLTGRPDRLADGNLENPTLERWFDASAFAPPPANAGRFGNSGRNVLAGPGMNVLHLSLVKDIALDSVREGFRVSFQAAFKNLFNHPNFTNPNASISSPQQVARITGVDSGLELGGARNVQLRLRVIW
jgi:hypothetical protein